MQYLDPAYPRKQGKLFMPAVSELKGKTFGVLNNGWRCLDHMSRRWEETLKSRHGVAEVRFYDVPRSCAPEPGTLERVARECQAAIVGLAN